jgi:hypothetical protein
MPHANSKEIFVAASYSSKVDYDTGLVFPEYKSWLEGILTEIEAQGHELFCALRADEYKINNADPAGAYKLDKDRIQSSDIFLALLEDRTSGGVQTEAGIAVACGKLVLLAHDYQTELSWFNQAMVRHGDAQEIIMPFNFIDFNRLLETA